MFCNFVRIDRRRMTKPPLCLKIYAYEQFLCIFSNVIPGHPADLSKRSNKQIWFLPNSPQKSGTNPLLSHPNQLRRPSQIIVIPNRISKLITNNASSFCLFVFKCSHSLRHLWSLILQGIWALRSPYNLQYLHVNREHRRGFNISRTSQDAMTSLWRIQCSKCIIERVQ